MQKKKKKRKILDIKVYTTQKNVTKHNVAPSVPFIFRAVYKCITC